MISKMREIYRDLDIANKIRISYIAVLVPMMALVIVCVINLYLGNRRYKDMIESAVVASSFSLDFKDDFDYETYLLIVGNKTAEDSKLPALLTDARRVVEDLKQYTDTADNNKRLESAAKYLDNLEIYKHFSQFYNLPNKYNKSKSPCKTRR